MRDRMERFVFLPFIMGCVSESSIGVGTPRYRRSKYSTPTTRNPQEEKEEVESEDDYEECYSGENLKNPSSIMPLPKFQRLFKNFKSISHIFEYKDEMDEPELEMEIGLPTNVKHVTHIGLDGSTTSILSQNWDAQRSSTLHEITSRPPNILDLDMQTKAETLDVQGPCS
ncbi:hypothetical protein LIER_25259 [Lithospermum erythrorhizon]|uniref:CRIB domain-containing protein n=1 Tax=Lithospermum erythrorhizon TaxID=34254 RepID=A0AAV3R5M7_LITER